MTRIALVGRRGSLRLAAAAAAVVVGCAGAAGGSASPDTTAAATTSTTTAAPTTTTTTTTAAPTTTAPPPPSVEAEAPDPVQVAIAKIGVNAPVIPLALEPSGALAAPARAEDTGWWRAGPEPGEPGAAVIAGHVDSRRAAAVFHRLRELAPGDVVEVVRADGSRVGFVVDHLEQHPKAAFPTDAVYGDTPGSSLRLITCGGVFDRSTGHYVDNVIVFANRL
ncbi:MAG TPA: class F sortase [Acidimicrobiales bacterium]|nr:class F sortase [Acidimicrobiales bacterium]